MNELPSVDRRTVARLVLAVMAAFALAATACQEGAPDRDAQPSVRDSVGVEIVETDGQGHRSDDVPAPEAVVAPSATAELVSDRTYVLGARP